MNPSDPQPPSTPAAQPDFDLDARGPHLDRRSLLATAGSVLTGLFLSACGLLGRAPREASGTPAAAASPEATGAAAGAPAEVANPYAPASTRTAAADQLAAGQLAPTPACEDDDETPSQTEGPYYTPDSPERTSLREAGITGQPLDVRGFVMDTNCQPLAGAIVDFWHCDADGVYDNQGYRLRGHQFTAANGSYSLATIMPGVYTGRTRHIHVKVQAPNRPVLTTQLYFPNQPQNATDGIFDEALVMAVQEAGEGMAASFDFVLA